MAHNQYHKGPSPVGTGSKRVSQLQSQVNKQRNSLEMRGIETPKESEGVISRIFDVLSRGQYATAEATRRTAENVRKDGFQLGDLGGIATGMASGLAGKSKTSYSDVLDEAGVENRAVKGIVGFAGDVLLDPTTYLTLGVAGAAKGIGKKAAQGIAEKTAYEAGQKAMTSKAVEQKIRRETAAALKSSKSGKLSAKAKQDIAEEARRDAFVRAQTRAEAKALTENPNRVEFKFMGKKFGESRRLYDSTTAAAEKLGSTSAGAVLNRAFRPIGVYGRQLNDLKRKYEGTAVGKWVDDTKALRQVGKQLTAEDRRIITYARESGEDLSGVMSSGRHKVDLGQVQKLGAKLMDDAYHLEVELGILSPDQFMPNYVKHIYRKGSEDEVKRFKKIRQKLVGTDDPSFAKVRSIATIARAKEAGLDPIEDFVEIVNRRMEEHHSTVARFLFEKDAAQEFGVRLSNKAFPAEANIDILYTIAEHTPAQAKILREYEKAKGFAAQADALKEKAYGKGKMGKDLEETFLADKERLEGIIESRKFALSEARKELSALRYTKKQSGIADPALGVATRKVRQLNSIVKDLEKDLEDRILKFTGSRTKEDVAAYKEAVKKANYHETRAKMDFEKLKPTKAEEKIAAARAKELGYVELKGLKNVPSGVYVPENVARVLGDIKKTIDTEDEGVKLLRYFDKVQNEWKTWATVMNPGHHFRNLIGDFWLNYIAGVPASAYPRYVGKIKLGGEDKVFYKGANGKKYSVTGDRLHHLYVNSGLKSGFTRAEFGHTVKAKGMENIRELSEAREEFVRHIHFAHAVGDELSKMKFKNVDFETALQKAADKAASRVRKHNIDYGDFTNFEQNTMKRIIPFYSFLRKNLPLQLEAIAMNPAKVGKLPKIQQMIEVLSGNDKREADAFDLIPQWLKEDSAAQLTNGDSPLFLSMGSIPFMDVGRLEGMKKILAGEMGGARELSQDFASMASPAMRIPFEQATGKQVFSGAPVKPGMQFAAGQVPMARTATQLVEFLQGERPPEEFSVNMTNYLTGIGLARVDENRQAGELRRIQDPLQKILREHRAQKRMELFGG